MKIHIYFKSVDNISEIDTFNMLELSECHTLKEFGHVKKTYFFLFSVLSHLFKTCKNRLPMHAIRSTINYFSTQILEYSADIDDSRWWIRQNDTVWQFPVNNWILLLFNVKVFHTLISVLICTINIWVYCRMFIFT